MILIACLDKNNGIGKNGKLLISIPDDMKFFRETTKDSIVIMGRKTLFSFKDRAPLKNRINIVFTNNSDIKNDYIEYDNIYFISEKSQLNEIINRYKEKKVFVIGGEKIYNLLIDDCDTAFITRLDKIYDADTFFPDLEAHNYKITEKSDKKTYEDITYSFITYKK